MAAGMLNTSDDRRELWTGFGDGLARAFELAVTPSIFGVLGYLLDRRLDLLPVFTLLFSIWALIWMFIKTWREYEANMQREESRRAGAATSTFGRVSAQQVSTDAPKRQEGQPQPQPQPQPTEAAQP